MYQLSFIEQPIWQIIKDGDPLAHQMYSRHYSYHHYKDDRRTNPNYRNRHLICGPGEKLLLMTPRRDALFVWRKFISDNGQQGVNCAVFRNESEILSSALIVEAMSIAWQRWPGTRLYTYVAGNKVASSNPGYCYLKAGWRKCGTTKTNKLLILECLPLC